MRMAALHNACTFSGTCGTSFPSSPSPALLGGGLKARNLDFNLLGGRGRFSQPKTWADRNKRGMGIVIRTQIGAGAGAKVDAASASSSGSRATWLPGLDPPPYLDGSLAGDFGFDPLELGKDPKNLRWYVQAELIHARFAMAGVAGILFTDLLRLAGLKNIPLWYEAGAMKFEFASTETLFLVQLILMGFVETKRYMDFINPGSQAMPGTFFGLEQALEGLETGYPGGPLFNPVGLARDIRKSKSLKLKEIKNGRLAMVAMVGIMVQASLTHTGPIDNLATHLSNPWHNTIIQTLANHGP
uniref:Chlorophyll a-b binding protein, chloroplastic n=1 Tax=Araucaria cunninghamii TaxID=56994 RepID=A0A0D6R6P8_ARACU